MSPRVVNLDSAHGEVRELLPWFVAGTLDGAESRLVDAHLQACAACRGELEWESVHLDTREACAIRTIALAIGGEPRPLHPPLRYTRFSLTSLSKKIGLALILLCKKLSVWPKLINSQQLSRREKLLSYRLARRLVNWSNSRLATLRCN